MHTANFTRHFCAAHRVWNDPSQCANIHGHNYDVTVKVELLDGDLTEQGFVVPFDAVKKAVDTFDHSLILHADDPLLSEITKAIPELHIERTADMPSTENMAQLIATRVLTEAMKSRMAVSGVAVGAWRFRVTVGLREGPGIHAEAVAE